MRLQSSALILHVLSNHHIRIFSNTDVLLRPSGETTIGLFLRRAVRLRFRPLATRNRQPGPRKASGEEVLMKGLVAAAGRCTRRSQSYHPARDLRF
jgi:hypothetical protein